MKKLFNFTFSQKSGKKDWLNPDRDWLILLITFTLITLITCLWLIIDYSNLWPVGDIETIKTEITKKTTINQKSLDQTVLILDQRAGQFDSLYKLAPKVVDPSL